MFFTHTLCIRVHVESFSAFMQWSCGFPSSLPQLQTTITQWFQDIKCDALHTYWEYIMTFVCCYKELVKIFFNINKNILTNVLSISPHTKNSENVWTGKKTASILSWKWSTGPCSAYWFAQIESCPVYAMSGISIETHGRPIVSLTHTDASY